LHFHLGNSSSYLLCFTFLQLSSIIFFIRSPWQLGFNLLTFVRLTFLWSLGFHTHNQGKMFWYFLLRDVLEEDWGKLWLRKTWYLSYPSDARLFPKHLLGKLSLIFLCREFQPKLKNLFVKTFYHSLFRKVKVFMKIFIVEKK